MNIKRIGLVLAGRRDAHRGLIQRLVVKPFFAPLGLRVIGGIIANVSDEYELLAWDETLRGEVTNKFIESLDVCFVSGLSTSLGGMERASRQAKDSGKIVIIGGKGVTGLYWADPKRNLEELLKWSHGVCVGQFTTRLCEEILNDCVHNSVKPVYAVGADEPIEWVVPMHNLAKDGYLFNKVTYSSSGCSDACPFCMVHRCLPGGKRRIFYPKPISVLRSEIESFIAKTPFKWPARILFGDWFIDVCDSFGEDLVHTFGDGSDPDSGVLPLYRWSGMSWGTESKVKTIKGDGDWRMLNEMARSGCRALYYGVEDVIKRATAKQAELEDVEELNKRALNSGIVAVGSLILDGRGDVTEDDIRRTIDWAVKSGTEIQFSNCASIDGSICQQQAVEKKELIDINHEFTDGAWPQMYREHASPKFRIEAVAKGYNDVFSYPQIFRRLQRRGFSRNACLAALGGLGVHFSIKSWAKRRDYNYWLSHRIKPTYN